jgi:hypothetical protein
MSSVFATPVALVSLIEEATLQMAAITGPFGPCVGRAGSMCDMVLVPPHPEVLVVEDLSTDSRFSGNEFVAGAPGARFYAGAPLVGAGGARYGTLCVVDVRPRHFSAELLQTLVNFAGLAVKELEREQRARRASRDRARPSRAASRSSADFREAAAAPPPHRGEVALVDVEDGFRVLYASQGWARLLGSGCTPEACAAAAGGLWGLLAAAAAGGEADARAAVAGGQAVQVAVQAAAGEEAGGRRPLRLTLRPASDALDGTANPVGVPAFVRMAAAAAGAGLLPRVAGADGAAEARAVRPTAMWFASLQPGDAAGAAADAAVLLPFGLVRTPLWQPARFDVHACSCAAPRCRRCRRRSALQALQAHLALAPAFFRSRAQPPRWPPPGPAAALQARPERYADLTLGPLLGVGSYGRVYRGVWRGEAVAVKIVELPAGDGGDGGDGAQRALVEGLLAQGLRHPNIVGTLDYAGWRQMASRACGCNCRPPPQPAGARAARRRAAPGSHALDFLGRRRRARARHAAAPTWCGSCRSTATGAP